MYDFYYHAISYCDFEGFYFCGGIFFVTIRIRGLVCEQIQGKKSYKQNNLPLYDQGLLQTWEVLKQAQAMGRQDDRCPQTRVMIWEMFQPHLQHYYQNYCPERKLYSLVSKCHILLLVLWKQEYMRTCVISNQGITPGGQSSNNLLFLLDCWEAFISLVNFDFKICWRRK